VATLAQQMVTDMATFTSVDEFGELVTVTSPAGTATANVPASFQEYLGAQDEKTQGPFIMPIASVPSIDRGWTITRANGDVWTVTDVSQRDVAAVNCRAALPQLTT
jgi:hypothetical protein